MSTYVIVDDIDPTIQYSAMLDPSSSQNGGWSHGSGVSLSPSVLCQTYIGRC